MRTYTVVLDPDPDEGSYNTVRPPLAAYPGDVPDRLPVFRDKSPPACFHAAGSVAVLRSRRRLGLGCASLPPDAPIGRRTLAGPCSTPSD